MVRGPRRTVVLVVAVALALGGCGDDGGDSAADASALPTPDVTATPSESCDDVPTDATHPDVVDASAKREGDEWVLSATLCSPYDTGERYADAWRALDAANGDVLAVRELAHDHADEQPFTRSTTIPLPDDVDTLVFEGRDLANGWGGATFELEIR